MTHDTPSASVPGSEFEENGASPAPAASAVLPENTRPEPSRHVGASTRAIVLGALLIPFNAYWMVRQERVMFGPYPSTMSLFANVVFALFVLVILNGLCRRLAPRLAFAQGELLTIYTMLAISTGLAGLDGAGILSQMIPHGAWFGQTNHWTGFLDAFPSWLVVRDRDILRGHFLGNSTFYRPDVLRAWSTPILAWTGFITLLLWVANCLNVLVRRQWADRERLTFPIIWLPLEMTDAHDTLSGSRPFFKNPLMWGGFAIAAVLSLWNGFAYLYPSIPLLPIGVTDLKPLFTAKPWSAIDWFPVTFYPLVIGLGFLLPLDLLFSCWFFFLFWKAQMVVSSAMAWDATPDFPFIKEQGFGSILGLFAFYLYTGRHTYAAIWRGAFGRREEEKKRRREEASQKPKSKTQNTEALSDRAALLGLAGGLMGLMAFCLAAHVAWWVAAVFFAFYLPTIAVITRIRAELGPPLHDFHFMGPDAMLPRVFSTSALKQPDMAFFTFSFAFTRAHRSDTMPVGLEGLQMAHLRRMDSRRMLFAIMLAVMVGSLSAFWAFEHQAYALGASAHFNSGYAHGHQAFERMNSWVTGVLDQRPNTGASSAIGVGLLTTLGLLWLRLRFFGFPLHPLGYALSSSWAIHLVWVPLLIAWVLKGITMRYGGLRLYRQLLPFALGLVLGDCVLGSLWALIGLVFNIPTYNFFGA
jgi:hypothetical protein